MGYPEAWTRCSRVEDGGSQATNAHVSLMPQPLVVTPNASCTLSAIGTVLSTPEGKVPRRSGMRRGRRACALNRSSQCASKPWSTVAPSCSARSSARSASNTSMSTCLAPTSTAPSAISE